MQTTIWHLRGLETPNGKESEEPLVTSYPISIILSKGNTTLTTAIGNMTSNQVGLLLGIQDFFVGSYVK